MPEEIEDGTTEVIDDGASDDAGDDQTEPDETEGDGDEDSTPSGKETDGEINVQDILDEYGLDSPDQLKDWLSNFKDLQGKIGNKDFDEILEGFNTLQTFQAKWAEEEREKLKDKETPEETIARLEKENEDLHSKRRKDRESRKAAEAAKQAINAFNTTVTSAIEGDKTLPAAWRPFVAEFMGVNNPVNEVDIEDKASVRRLTKEGVKKMNQFAQLVIKEYRDGKVKVPKVSNSDTPPSKAAQPKKVKNLNDSRRLAHEAFEGIFNKK